MRLEEDRRHIKRRMRLEEDRRHIKRRMRLEEVDAALNAGCV